MVVSLYCDDAEDIAVVCPGLEYLPVTVSTMLSNGLSSAAAAVACFGKSSCDGGDLKVTVVWGGGCLTTTVLCGGGRFTMTVLLVVGC